MATILRDLDIDKLLGKVIKNGSKENIRPNSYIIRLGSKGEYIGTGREFELGEDKEKKGIKLPPGQSVGVSSIEELDFSKETVNSLFPDQALHGFLSPTTDLSREGVIVTSTQIDAGFCGSLSWTLSNTSSQERRYIYGEAIFRLTIFKLDKNETPEIFYNGYYQGKTGYVRSNRKGAPVGMRENEWEEPYLDDGPEESLERLMNAGYPWQAVAIRLTEIDNQSKIISSEYLKIKTYMDAVDEKIANIGLTVNEAIDNKMIPIMKNLIRDTVEEEIPRLYNWAIIRLIGSFAIIAGLILTIITNQQAMEFLSKYGVITGLAVIIIGSVLLIIRSRPKKIKHNK
jgi:deoxycytidine triphosphate deaminase